MNTFHVDFTFVFPSDAEELEIVAYLESLAERLLEDKKAIDPDFGATISEKLGFISLSVEASNSSSASSVALDVLDVSRSSVVSTFESPALINTAVSQDALIDS